MVQSIIDLSEHHDRILNIVKARHGFKNKSQAVAQLIVEYEEQLEPELRPEYVEKMKKIEKGEGKGFVFKNIEELRARYGA